MTPESLYDSNGVYIAQSNSTIDLSSSATLTPAAQQQAPSISPMLLLGVVLVLLILK